MEALNSNLLIDDNNLITSDEKKDADENDCLAKNEDIAEKLAALDAALQSFTPIEDALAALHLSSEDYNLYLDTLGLSSAEYVKQQYGIGLVSFRQSLSILAATKPTAAKLLYDDLVNRGIITVAHIEEKTPIVINFTDGEE